MPSTINAITSGGGGLATTADSSGVLNLQSSGSTVASISSTGVAVTGTLSATGAISSSSSITASGFNTASTFGFKNRIINGAMVIDQRNNGASVTVNTSPVYPVDRFYCAANSNGIFTAQRSATAPSGFTNSVILTVTTPRTSIAATDVYGIRQSIEGFNFADFGFGTANAQAVTLSFWVRSSITGTYAVAFWNSSFNRNYVATYTINSANTWEQKTVTITGDTSGTWETGNGQGITVYWDLGSGSNYNGTAGSWSAGGAIRTSGSTNWISTNGATFYITGVQLEKGSTATSFDFRSIGTELALCQRYYQTASLTTASVPLGTTSRGASYSLKVTMRATPTTAYSSVTAFNSTGGALSSPTVADNQVSVDAISYLVTNFSTAAQIGLTLTATAEL